MLWPLIAVGAVRADAAVDGSDEVCLCVMQTRKAALGSAAFFLLAPGLDTGSAHQ